MTRARRAVGPRLAGLSLPIALLAACASGGASRAPAPPGADGGAVASRDEATGVIAPSPESLGAARDRAPGDVRAHLAYVEALVAGGRRSRARDEYAARARAPGALEVDRVLAERLASDGASSTLRRLYAAAAAREPAVPWWPLALAEVELAEADAWNQRRLKAIDAGDRAAETKAYGQARGALARAEADLAGAARLDATLPETALYRGHLRALEGDVHGGAAARQAAYRAALDAFQHAVALDRESLAAWAGLADVAGRLGEANESLKAWLEVARRSPGDPEARRSVATLLHQQGRQAEAVEQYRVLATLRPGEGEPWLRMGDALADLERWEEALAAYEEALRRDGALLESHVRMGAVHEHRGRLPEARAAYQRYVDQGGPKRAEIERRLERLLHAPAGR